MKTYIGKKYIPQDNSYSKNLSNGNGINFVCLAGIPNKYQRPEITTIKSDPFDVLITEHSNHDTYKFILVETVSKETYFVMFHERGVISDTNSSEDIFKRVDQQHIDIMTSIY